MDPLSILGSLGGSLISGIFGKAGADKTAAAQQAMAAQNLEQQREFAQNRIQWTVADAKAAGINPLAALGNATQSFTNLVGADNAGGGLTAMGQNVGRALSALTSKQDESEKLNNDLTRAKIANVNADTVRQTAEASRQAVNNTAKPVAIEGPKKLFDTYVDDAGGLHKLPSKDASSAMQNWASLPAQIPIAVSQAGDAIYNEYHKLADPIHRYVKDMNSGFIPPGTSYRRLSPSSSDYYYTPF